MEIVPSSLSFSTLNSSNIRNPSSQHLIGVGQSFASLHMQNSLVGSQCRGLLGEAGSAGGGKAAFASIKQQDRKKRHLP